MKILIMFILLISVSCSSSKPEYYNYIDDGILHIIRDRDSIIEKSKQAGADSIIIMTYLGKWEVVNFKPNENYYKVISIKDLKQ